MHHAPWLDTSTAGNAVKWVGVGRESATIGSRIDAARNRSATTCGRAKRSGTIDTEVLAARRQVDLTTRGFNMDNRAMGDAFDPELQPGLTCHIEMEIERGTCREIRCIDRLGAGQGRGPH